MKTGISNSLKTTMRSKTIAKIENLVDDIYKLFDPNIKHEASEENLDEFANNLKDLLRSRLGGRKERDGAVLRFSALGTPDRKLWYAAHAQDEAQEMSPKTYFKFLYGDVIEALVLFLCKESGHEVTDEQAEVEVEGVTGHIDAIIDGVVVDVKSASPFGFKKFKDNRVHEDDAFGYIPQISGYSNVLTPGESPAFLAFDKVSGELCLTRISSSITSQYDPAEKIKHQKEIVARDEPPERCYEDVPDGKSGNRKLSTPCSYCHFNNKCWADANGGYGLRTFLYSTGPRYLTNVAKEPDVYETTKGY